MLFGNDWDDILKDEIQKPYFHALMEGLEQEYNEHTVYPPKSMIFQALKLTSYADTKVVILGQDPYHGPGQAHGLSFSVLPGVAVPPSLRNIYKELNSDIGMPIPSHGTLTSWAEQGVLMLNAILTVEKGKPGSHQGWGWERFTDAVVAALNERSIPVVFLLWGNYAMKKGAIIDPIRHEVIVSSHPSPFAARKGFFGSKPFSRANDTLERIGAQIITWEII